MPSQGTLVDLIYRHAGRIRSGLLQKEHFQAVRGEGIFEEGDEGRRNGIGVDLLQLQPVNELNVATGIRRFDGLSRSRG